jgi:Condensation domain
MQYPTLSVQDHFILASGLKASTNTVPAAWRIDGNFGPEQILRAVQLVVDGHESLRTRIVRDRRSYAQRVSSGGGVSQFIRRVDLSRNANAEDAMSDLMGRLLAHEFDLTAAPLWRGFLARVGRGHSVLGIAFAHVIIDGSSVAVFGEDLARALATGALPEPLQLGKLAQAERRISATDEQRRYWTDRYQRRTALESAWNGTAHYRVEPVPMFQPKMVDALSRLATRLEVSISTMFAAATALSVTSVLDRANPMLGFTTAQRTRENRGVFGPLHDHLPVLGGGAPARTPFAEFVRGLHARRDQARKHRLPSGLLAKIADATPYDVAVNYSPFAPPKPQPVGDRGYVTARPIPTIGKVNVERATSVAPVLAAILRPNADGSVTGDITAISALHGDREVRAIARALYAVAERALKNPDIAIGRLA